MAREFPEVMFYDYSKNPRPYLRERPNHRITFPRSETKTPNCVDALKHGVKVAVVFDAKPSTAKVCAGQLSSQRWFHSLTASWTLGRRSIERCEQSNTGTIPATIILGLLPSLQIDGSRPLSISDMRVSNLSHAASAFRMTDLTVTPTSKFTPLNTSGTSMRKNLR